MSDYLDNLYSNSDEPSAIVAGIGFNDGANNGFWRKQPRKEWGRGKGQWLFMGAKVRLLAKHNGKRVSVTGRVIGSDGSPNGARFLPDPGQEHLGFDSNTIYGVDTKHIEEISAQLSENYVESQGIDMPNDVGGTGSTVDDATIPNVESLETAPATPDDFRLADEGIDSPEGKQMEEFKNTPEGKEIARLSAESADVATPEEVANLVDSNPTPSLASQFKPATAAWMNNANEEDVFISFPGRDKLIPAWVSEGYVYTGDKNNPKGLGSVEEFMDGKKNGSGITIYKGEVPMIDGRTATRQDAINAATERMNAVYAAKKAKAATNTPEATIPAEAPNLPEDMPEALAQDAVSKAMRGEYPGTAEDLIEANKGKPTKTKRSSKKKDEEKPIDDGLGDFDPEKDLLDENIDYPSEGRPELDRPIKSKEYASADSIGIDDIIQDDHGDPVKVTGVEWEQNADGEDTGNIVFTHEDVSGTESTSKYDQNADVPLLTLGEPDSNTNEPNTIPESNVPDAITPEDVVTPEEDTPAGPRIAPDTAEMVEANDLQVGDTIYSKDGTEKYGTITAVVHKGNGTTRITFDPQDGGKPETWDDLYMPQLTERGAKNEEAPSDIPEATPTPEPTPTPQEVPTPEEIPTPEESPEAPTPPVEIPDGRDAGGPPPPGGPNGGEPPMPPEGGGTKPDETEKPATPDKSNRTDHGQEIAFPDKTEADMREKKITPLRDSSGRRVKSIDPETGEEKSTFAEDPDAILNAILEEYPDAVIDEHGAIIVARQKFTNPDGSEYTMESRITRTNGANYMVSYKITSPDGTTTEYFSNDYRDSFSSIHGKTNGIKRMADVLSGNMPADFLPTAQYKKSREWKTYFGTGKFADRMKYFRDKNRSTVTLEKLQENLDKANKSANLYDIGRAQYHLDLLNNEFGGDINKLRDYLTTQNMAFLTIDETIQRYASGRFYKVNKSKGSNFGNVMRSAVNGIFGAAHDGDLEGFSATLRELLGRLPDVTKDQRVIQQVMKSLEDGLKARHPNDNRNTLRRLVRDGVKILEERGFDEQTLESYVNMGWDGRALTPGMLVEYTNNNNEMSVGYLDSIVPVNKRNRTDNEYNDYVIVSFRDQAGNITHSAKVASKQLRVLDETGTSPESQKRITVYTPNITHDEKLVARFGIDYLIQERARESATSYFGVLSEIGSGVNVPNADPAFHSTDNATPGKYLYDAKGLPLGQIAAVRDLKSDSGEDGYSIAYVTPDNKLEFIGVKAGEIRAPKEGLAVSDGRGSNESDAGFTPNPADFQDIGLDASSLGTDSVDSEAALVDLAKSSPLVGAQGSARIVGRLLAVKNARAVYHEDPSEANLKTYKDALSKYYEDLSRMTNISSAFDNKAFTPMSVSGDDILTPQDVADINGKIRATQMETPKPKPDAPEIKRLSYDELKDAVSAPEHTYVGFLPAGWSPQDNAANLDFEKAKHADTVKKIVSVLGGDSTNNVSDAVADALAEGILRNMHTNIKNGTFEAPKRHALTNEFGDVIRITVNGAPGSGNGYVAKDAEIQKGADVFKSMREKLNIGDKPLALALDNRGREGGALGFVYTADMWADNAFQAQAHLLVDTLPGNVKNIEADTTRGEKFKEGESWWSVDLSKDPAGMLPEYVIAHEMGHVMQGESLRQFGKILSQRTWNEFYGPVARSYKVSEYGTTNYNEHFAESFVKYLMTGKAHPEFLKFLKDSGLLKSK